MHWLTTADQSDTPLSGLALLHALLSALLHAFVHIFFTHIVTCIVTRSLSHIVAHIFTCSVVGYNCVTLFYSLQIQYCYILTQSCSAIALCTALLLATVGQVVTWSDGP